MAQPPPRLKELQVGIPFARYAPDQPPTPPTTATGTATPGDSQGADYATRYGRLTNPDLLVAAGGQWVRVQSTFLWAIRFVPYAEDADAPIRSVDQQTGDLYLEFVNGFIGLWDNRTYGDYRAYLSAPSKGKHHRRTPWYRTYQTIRPQQYTGKALAARIKANG